MNVKALEEEDEDYEIPADNQSLEIDLKGIKDLSENNTFSVIEFTASSYAVLENEQICRILIERYGKLDNEITFK